MTQASADGRRPRMQRRGRTMKKVMVLPPWMVPYSMLVWSARSSGDSMGTSIL